MASSFYQQGIHVKNVDDFLAGLKAMLTGAKPEISLEEAGEALEAFYNDLEKEASERNAAAGAAAKAEGEKFLADMAKDASVKATPSGLMYKVIKEGTGRKPRQRTRSTATMRAPSPTARSSTAPTRGASPSSSASTR